MTTPDPSPRATNLTFERLTRDSKFPNLVQCIVLSICVAIAASAMIVHYNFDPPRYYVITLWWVPPALGLPPVAGLAAFITARDAQSEAYSLLKLTLLSRASVVWGTFWASLYRARVLLAVLIGVFVAPIIAYAARGFEPPFTPYTILQFETSLFNVCHAIVPLDSVGIFSSDHLICERDLRWWPLTNLFVATYISVLAAAIPLAMLGVTAGLAGRRAVSTTTVITMLVAVILLIGEYQLLYYSIRGWGASCLMQCSIVHVWPRELIPTLIYLAAGALMTFGLARLAWRYV